MHLAPLLALAPLVPTLQDDWSPPPPPPVVPAPMMSQPRFAPFVVPDELRVVTAEPDLQLLAPVVASLLGDLLERPVVVGAPPSRSGDVVLTLGYLADPVAAAPEGFSVEVFADHVALSGNGLEGVARATARLVQLFEHDAQTGAWSLPPVRLDDAPLYPWRALEPTEALDPDAALRAIDLAFLASFNVVVLDGGAWPPERAAELEGAAFVRGIRVVRSDGTELPYDVTPFDDEGERPLRWTVGAEGDDLKLARRFAARAFVDATGGVPRLVSGPPAKSGLLDAFGYRPLAPLLSAWPATDGAVESPSVLGAHVPIDASLLRDPGDLPPLLPYATDALWGRRAAEVGADAFRERAGGYLRRLERLRPRATTPR